MIHHALLWLKIFYNIFLNFFKVRGVINKIVIFNLNWLTGFIWLCVEIEMESADDKVQSCNKKMKLNKIINSSAK